MNVVLPTFAQIEERVLARLRGTSLSDLSEGSITRMLLRTVISELTDPGGLWDQIQKAGKAAHPGTAEGAELDGVGTYFGVTGERRAGESDAEYRYRMSRIVESQQPGSLESIRYAAQGMPGVTEVVVRPYVYGPGSFAMAVLGQVDVPAIDRAVQTWVAPGSYYRIYQARQVAMKLSVSLRFTSKATEPDRMAAKVASEQAIRRHILSLGLGKSVSLDLVRRAAIESHPAIVECQVASVEVGGIPAPLQDVLVPWDSVATFTASNPVEVKTGA